MTQFLSAFQLHEIPREEGGAILASQSAQDILLQLIAKTSLEHGGKLVQVAEDYGVYSYGNIAMAIEAGISIQKQLDGRNDQNHLAPIELAAMGIVSLVNPFTGLVEQERSLELVGFLAKAASAGELYLSEGAYNAVPNPESLSCRFVRQLIRTGETWALNAYEVFWVPTEVELGKLDKDPNEVDQDIQPIRSFGLKLFFSILFLFFAVLMLTIGWQPVWAFFIKIVYK
ncbi:hypothetical protein [Polynucleobacter sp. UK-Kesae-W10]|uniref:hypothetical protein n=1 Tax=Polynucleobacter sp. UK-Kesae-W10 TaxID=1819738 RepID=UPI001C0B820D|nr:hypothetical protein [Polynucleobacter sp. UK-Kesae-W10]MBU3577833.1 hypothetical protein [Polynucleobacter sp. UK-Kesae-W10]